MKKLAIAFLAAFMLGGALAQAQQAQQTQAPPFPDIPAGHWAADAVARIAKLGIVIGFPDGTFRGNESFTRYQAALVVSRMLDVINSKISAAKAMTDQDIASLRNALQSLSSDVASQGNRLSAAEQAISDLQGSVSSIKDNVSSNTSRIDALEQALKNAQAMGANAQAIKDLQNQLDAQKAALDTAQAQAQAAQDLAQQNASDIKQLQAKVAQNADAIDALNNVVKLLNDQVSKLQSQVGGLPTAQPGVPVGLQDQVARNTSDIANIRDFAILLRKDQVALGDRVSALEQADQEQNAKIADLGKRVTKLEQNAITFSGSLEVDYTVMRLSGDSLPFDSDRLWGLNSGVSMGHERDIGASAFSTGAKDLNGNGNETDTGETAQDRQDITSTEGHVTSTLTLTIGFLKERTKGASSNPHGLNNVTGVVVLNIEPVNYGESGVTLRDNDGNAISNPYIFSIGTLKTTFNIGATPLMFSYGAAPTASFTPYVLDITGDNSDGGFVATVGSPDFLKFINPTVEVVYGHVNITESYSSDATTAGGVFPPGYPTYCHNDTARNAPGLNPTGTCWSNDSTTDNLFPNTYYRGARLTLSPFSGLTLGGSAAQVTAHAGENANAAGDNQTLTVYGGDANLSLSIFNLSVEYAKQQGSISSDPSATNGKFKADGTALGTETRGGSAALVYAKLSVDGKNIPILKSLTANYRDIPSSGVWDGVFSDSDNYPFTNDQAGFGVKGDLGLFIVDLKPYFDHYVTAQAGTPNPHLGGQTTNQAYGVDAQVNLFAGFSLTGFFHSVSFNGQQIDVQDTARVQGSNPTDYGDIRRDSDYDTGFGGGIKLDGSADNALIPGLNLSASYAMINAGFDTPKISASADYTLNVSILKLTPYVGYTSIHSPDSDADNTVTLEAGTGLTTKPFNIFLKPSLLAAVNYRNTAHSGPTTYSYTDPAGTAHTASSYTANEFQWSVGVALNKFLFQHSTLTARYGSWTGKNINLVTNTQRDSDTATDISGGDAYTNGTQQNTTGYEVTWNYYDLALSYGAYSEHISGASAADGEATGGQAFSISYKVNF